MKTKVISIALAGNPNSGKSSLFNLLTGLNQKIANFPGVTVEKKSGKFLLANGDIAQLVDYPGAYSMHAITLDEQVFTKLIEDRTNQDYPDIICYVINAEHIERHLLLATQLQDLEIPTIIALSMSDIENLDDIKLNSLREMFRVPVIQISSRTGEGLEELKNEISKISEQILIGKYQQQKFLQNTNWLGKLEDLKLLDILKITDNSYTNFLSLISFSNKNDGSSSASILKAQVWDTMLRYDQLQPLIKVLKSKDNVQDIKHGNLDRILVHPIWGMLIFTLIMLVVFQSIFSWSEKPIEFLENAFSYSADLLSNMLPSAWWSDMIINGVIPGLSGIIVFVPQIMFLFFFISILEETGYMSRVVYLFDFWMRKFGLNGRSTIALIAGGACAIPAIMSTRTISNWKERLITILVTPLISCSARLPVYSLLIVFIIPVGKIFGLLNYRGLAFFGIYVFSTLAALFAAWVFKKILKSNEPSQLMLELPNYKMPIIKNVAFNVWEKVRSFIVEAGKVIFVISVILWALTSYGPEERIQEALIKLEKEKINNTNEKMISTESSIRLENSYAGVMGHWIEPAIRPLGFDWKIGIALIASFAAREVFVGTVATIYSSHDDGENTEKLSVLLSKQINPNTGKKVFNIATSASLIMFYMFAMQCLSTVAVVKKETGSWKWPIIQLVIYTLLAYLASLLTYNLLAG